MGPLDEWERARFDLAQRRVSAAAYTLGALEALLREPAGPRRDDRLLVAVDELRTALLRDDEDLAELEEERRQPPLLAAAGAGRLSPAEERLLDPDWGHLAEDADDQAGDPAAEHDWRQEQASLRADRESWD